MKQFLLKLSGFAAIALLLHSTGFAQEQAEVNKDKVITEKSDKLDNGDEIIIKRKGDKDIKVTVEVKGDQILVNGKPIAEFDGGDIIVKKIKPFYDGESIDLVAPRSPFRGGWSYSGDGDFMNMDNAKVGFLGVTTEDAENGSGAKINEVTKGSAAEKAGLKAGDIITKIDDKKIGNGELTETVRKYKPEDKVTVTYTRDGKEQKTTATLGRLRQMKMKTFSMAMPKMNQNFSYNGDNYYSFSYSGKAKLGIKAQDLEEGKGAKVLDVDDESPADKAGIKEGDIITEFEGKPVENADDLAKLARENKEKYNYKIKLTRDGKSQEVQVKIPKKLKTADL